MGIGDTLKKIGRGRGTIRDRCDKNPDTGEVICRRIRVNQDNTEVELAGFSVTADPSCRVDVSTAFENEEGQLEALEKKFLPKIKSKCKNTPPDY